MTFIFDVTDIYIDFVHQMIGQLGPAASSNDYHEFLLLSASYVLDPDNSQTTEHLHACLADYGLSEPVCDHLVGHTLLRFSHLFRPISRSEHLYDVQFISPEFLEVTDYGTFPVCDDVPAPFETQWYDELQQSIERGDYIPERQRTLRG